MSRHPRVRDWIDGFLTRHRARYDPHDWPDAEAEAEEWAAYATLWITAFATKEVTEKEADEASASLALTPPNFRREHIPAVVASVEEARRKQGQGPAPTTVQAAREASRSCEHCGGEGLATIWSEKPDLARRIPATVSATCVCPAGKLIRSNHAEHNPELLRRIPDFGRVLDGDVPGWLAEPPKEVASHG